MKTRFPDVPYLHITLTMPEEFRSFFGEEDDEKWSRKKALYELGWKCINGYLRNKKIEGGCLVVQHTYGRALNINPHLHIIAPAGGLKKTKSGEYKWEEVLHIARAYLAISWKNNLLRYILENTPELRIYTETLLAFQEKRTPEMEQKVLRILRKSCPEMRKKSKDRCNQAIEEWENKWLKVLQIQFYVNIKKKKQYEQTICYAARYTRRLPIAKSRILAWDKEAKMVTWSYQPHNEPSPISVKMHVFQFFEMLFKHIPPKHFRTVRYYGIFSSKKSSLYRDDLEKVCRFNEPAKKRTWAERYLAFTGKHPLTCACCSRPMVLVEKSHRQKNGVMQYERVKVISIKVEA
jgi:hypothetical protein